MEGRERERRQERRGGDDEEEEEEETPHQRNHPYANSNLRFLPQLISAYHR